MKFEQQFRIIDEPYSVDLPHPDSIVGTDEGGTTPIFPIFDREYGGVIAWANTAEQADRIVKALTKGSQ
jgi:hypothetical protein